MKTIYVLGAGCSCEDNAPLVKDFFPKLERIVDTVLKNHQDIANFKKIIEFKHSLFNEFNIEEFFSIIDFYISMGIKFRQYDLNSIRSKLIYLIASTIRYSLANKTESTNYKEFYSKILTGDDTIISLNWDLLLDNVREGMNYGGG